MADDAGHLAADRAARAGRRIEELELRLSQIVAGDRASQADALKAAAAAATAMDQEGLARRRLYAAYESAALCHRHAAAVMEQLGLHNRAVEHLALALVDEAAAIAGMDYRLPEQLPVAEPAPVKKQPTKRRL